MVRRLLPLLLLSLPALLTACDLQARPAPESAAAPPANPSRLGETCDNTAACAEGLRCVAGLCRRPTTSRVGEYLWAQGRALAAKPNGAAAEPLMRAMGQFEADKQEIPAGLLCDLGAALRKKPNDPRSWEQAARFLHRCVLASAPGSAESARAYAELVELEAAGLDPQLLVRDQPVDTYLTRAPSKPSADGLRVDVEATEAGRDRGYAAWVEVLKGPAAQAVYRRCYEPYLAGGGRAQLRLLMPLKLRAVLGDDDIYVDGRLDLGADPAATGAEATLDTCVRDGLADAAKEFGKKGSSGDWSGSVTLVFSVGQ